MIDYNAHRKRMAKMCKSLTRPHVSFTPSDAAELLDKAEGYEKLLNAIVCLDSPGTARNIKIGIFEYVIIHLRQIEAIKDPAPVEEEKA